VRTYNIPGKGVLLMKDDGKYEGDFKEGEMTVEICLKLTGIWT
jgi:hypothetical protein